MAASLEARRDAFAQFVRRQLTAALTTKGWSVPRVAKVAGIGSNTIYRWRDGNWKEGPKPEQIVAFCDALDISPSAAFGILWPGKSENVTPVGPVEVDPDVALLMRKLNDPNVPEYEKYLIRETLQGLAARPQKPALPRDRKRRGVAS